MIKRNCGIDYLAVHSFLFVSLAGTCNEHSIFCWFSIETIISNYTHLYHALYYMCFKIIIMMMMIFFIKIIIDTLFLYKIIIMMMILFFSLPPFLKVYTPTK